MARIAKPLTNTQVNNAKPKQSLYRLFDGNGLCLKVTPVGSKIWEYRYRNPDTWKGDTLIIGEYPLVSLAEARNKHLELRKLVVNEKINPKNKNTKQLFKDVFEEWFKIYKKDVAEKTAHDQYSVINNHCMKYLGHMNVDKIQPIHVINALKAVEETGSTSQIKRAKSCISRVLSAAAERGLCSSNPASIVTLDSFAKHKEEKHKTLAPKNIYLLNNFLQENTGASKTTKLAIEMALRTCCRIQEVVMMRWEYIDTENQIIIIPSEIMKMDRPHYVPIFKQIQNILDQSKNESEYIFASGKSHLSPTTPVNTLNRNKIDTSIHGLRHLSSTILNETKKFDKDIVESLLAHLDSDKIRGTYNNAQYIYLKRKALQFWSDFIDKCNSKENNEKALQDENIIIL